MARMLPITRASGTLPSVRVAATAMAMPSVHTVLRSRLRAAKAPWTWRSTDWSTMPTPDISNTAANGATGSHVSQAPATTTRANSTTAMPAATVRGLVFIWASGNDNSAEVVTGRAPSAPQTRLAQPCATSVRFTFERSPSRLPTEVATTAAFISDCMASRAA